MNLYIRVLIQVFFEKKRTKKKRKKKRGSADTTRGNTKPLDDGKKKCVLTR